MNASLFCRGFVAICAVMVVNTAVMVPDVHAQSADALIKEGEVYDQRFEPGKALKSYLAAEKMEPDNGELQMRIARQYRHLMSDTRDKKEKLRLGNLSLRHASRAAQLLPKNSEAQLSPAISYGKMMEYMGSRDQVKASPLIKASVDKAIALDPRNDTAWHILGRWQRVLADVKGVKRALAGAIFGKLPETSIAQAEKSLLRAIAINPNRLMHYVELGRIYAQAGQKPEARKALQKALSMPNKEHDDPENKRIAKETLKKL